MKAFEKIAKHLKEIGRSELAKGVLKSAGRVISHQTGGLADPFLKRIAKKAGIREDASPEELAVRLETIASKNLTDAQAELLSLEIEYEKELIDLQKVQEQEDTKRLASVRELMAAEVIANPKAATWRPLWGKIGAIAWAVQVAVILALLAIDVIRKEYMMIQLAPIIATVLGILNSPLMIIVGASAWHRGVEKRILAGQGGNA